MKKMLCLWLLLLCGCQSQNDTTIEIQKHVFVEKEFRESWLETCQDGRTYLQLVLDGGYVYQTNERYLSLFYQDGGHIELHNYSIRKDQMIISGEFIPEKTISKSPKILTAHLTQSTGVPDISYASKPSIALVFLNEILFLSIILWLDALFSVSGATIITSPYFFK